MARRLVHLRLLLAVGLVVVAATVTAGTPAAAHTDVCVGQGTMQTGVLPAPVTVTHQDYPVPRRTVTVNQPRWVNFGFVLTLGTCTLNLGKYFTASGGITGWCGHSSGYGTLSDGHAFAWIEAGGVALITGRVTGIAHITADPLLPANDCFTNAVGFPPRASEVGATRFIVTFAFGLSHCTNVDQWTTLTVPTPPTLTRLFTIGAYDFTAHTGPSSYHARSCV